MKRHEQGGLLHAVLLGTGMALGAALLLALLAAVLLQTGVLPEGAMEVAKICILFPALFLGGLLSAKRAGKQRLLAATIPALAVCIVGLLCRLTVWRGGAPRVLTTLLPAAAGAALAAFFSARKKKRFKR